jgi:VWFA-related protein
MRTLVLLFAVALAASSQTIKVDVKVVNVLCTVTDHRGALVTNLSKSDFEIRENGTLQRIQYFSRETDLPLTIALLVDVSGSVRRFVDSEKDTAVQFFRDVLRPQDQALITGFSSTLVLWQDFTASLPQLGDALAGMHAVPFKGLPKDGGPMPTTLLYDSVASVSANKLQNVSGRKTILLISDGIDIGSRASLATAVREAQSANAIVYAICYPNPHESGCGYLKALADPTGGRMFDLASRTPLSEIFRTIQQELRSQYSLGYTPAISARDGAFRKIEVKLKRPGLHARTRKGYYAELR